MDLEVNIVSMISQIGFSHFLKASDLKRSVEIETKCYFIKQFRREMIIKVNSTII